MENAINTFEGGMILDYDVLNAPHNVLTSALNATFSTFNGSELILQNDFGNVPVDYLPNGYVPIGVTSFGGIMYLALIKEESDEQGIHIKGLIGSFPSPNYDSGDTKGTLVFQYSPLRVGLNGENTVDLDTEFFNFDKNHPVKILAEESFDGSVDLIINDNYNSPRLINTGFAVQEGGTFEIILRYGNNNTNRYDISTGSLNIFNLQTSLYRNSLELSKFKFNGLRTGGKLKVGNYVFYAVSCDKDGNESDIICESGVISVFLGIDGDPFSVSGGVEDLQSDKSIDLEVENIDNAYSYIKLYYTRASSGNNQFSSSVRAFKIDKMYEVKEGKALCIITGYESTIDISIDDLNILYFNADKVKTQELNQNILFLGNLEEDNGVNNYDKLRQLALTFYPKAVVNSGDNKFKLNHLYENGENSYYSSKFIYENTGYHNEEYYRFGIVFIKNDGDVTSVFDIQGNLNLNTDSSYFNYVNDNAPHDYNIYGVSKFNVQLNYITDIIGVEFTSYNTSIKLELSNLGIKGYFFVRQKRIPTILGTGYATNVCEESFLPSINVPANLLANSLNKDISDEDRNNTDIRYLYESDLTGAFQTSPKTDTIWPVKTASKPTNTLFIRNNYKSRLFSLTNNTWAYLDKILLGGTVSSAYSETGGVSKSLFSGGTQTPFEWKDKDEISHTGIVLCWAIREDKKWGILENIVNEDSLYQYMILEEVLLDEVLGKTFIHITDDQDDDKVDGGDLSSSEVGCFSNFIKSNWDSGHYTQYRNLVLMSICALSNQINAENSSTWNFYKWCPDPPNEEDPIYFSTATTEEATTLGIPTGLVYKLILVFSAKSSNSNTAYDTLINYILNYIQNDENANSGDSVLLQDPTTPTFDGKYKDTVSLSNDEFRIHLNPMEAGGFAIFCPEFELNQITYNNIITGNSLKIRSITNKALLDGDLSKRHFYYTETGYTTSGFVDSNAIGVSDSVSLISVLPQKELNYSTSQLIDWPRSTIYFSSKAGDVSTVLLKFVGYPYISHVNLKPDLGPEIGKCGKQFPFNMVRGLYGPYIGACTYTPVGNSKKANISDISNRIVTLYYPGYDPTEYDVNNKLIEVRQNDKTSYQAISDRYAISECNNSISCYRGDCFINYYTHRVNRNFNDSTAPYNDTIIDSTSFNEGFDKCFDGDYRTLILSSNPEASLSFNLGDLNAVQLGSWVTFPCRTSINTALRGIDESFISEKLLSGNYRTFYPYHPIDASGSNKMPESDVYNLGFSKSGSERYYFNLNQQVYNNNYYKTRIQYSNLKVNSSISNGNRVFLETHYRDYTDQYGAIVKLVSLGSDLICVCEHGILLIPVNERALAGEGSGGFIFINTSNVLPENPRVISDKYGSLWEDSIIKTPYGVYGVDGVAKKIWYVDGSSIKLISDFKVQEFLNNALSMYNKAYLFGEVNIKSHYNQFKNDVMFTAYDYNEQILWNLCWNENIATQGNGWTTFYSWIPSYSTNIGNTFLSFDLTRDRIIHGLLGRNEDESNFIFPHAIWKHGQSSFAGDTKTTILPTNWYGELHPFEFEFIVNNNPLNHKIFNDLRIISNKAEPESFHYEVSGECYELFNDKATMYQRQELTKLFFSCYDDNILYNKNFATLQPKHHVCSTLFPLYYSRVDTKNIIYDSYQLLHEDRKDYQNLSGGELYYSSRLNLFYVCNHVKGVNMRTVEVGPEDFKRIRGNMHYKEDGWCVQINSIPYLQKNELYWSIIPIAAYNSPVPEGVIIGLVTDDCSQMTLFNETLQSLGYPNYTCNNFDLYPWTEGRREMRLKDKYIKIKIRYSGKDLAIISAIFTFYTNSYS